MVLSPSGTVDQDYTMVAGTQDYVLSGTVKVGDGNGVISSASEMSAIQAAGVTLTIEPVFMLKVQAMVSFLLQALITMTSLHSHC